MAKRKPTDKVQLKVRLQENLRADLERAAKKNGVSLNQEIVNRLAWSLSAPALAKLDIETEDVRARLKVLEDRLIKAFPDLAKSK